MWLLQRPTYDYRMRYQTPYQLSSLFWTSLLPPAAMPCNAGIAICKLVEIFGHACAERNLSASYEPRLIRRRTVWLHLCLAPALTISRLPTTAALVVLVSSIIRSRLGILRNTDACMCRQP